jgi:hypothetical protein
MSFILPEFTTMIQSQTNDNIIRPLSFPRTTQESQQTYQILQTMLLDTNTRFRQLEDRLIRDNPYVSQVPSGLLHTLNNKKRRIVPEYPSDYIMRTTESPKFTHEEFKDQMYEYYGKKTRGCGACMKWDVPGIMYLHHNREEHGCYQSICVKCYLRLEGRKKFHNDNPLLTYINCPWCTTLPSLEVVSRKESNQRQLAYETYQDLLHGNIEKDEQHFITSSLYGPAPTDISYIQSCGDHQWKYEQSYQAPDGCHSTRLDYLETYETHQEIVVLLGLFHRTFDTVMASLNLTKYLYFKLISLRPLIITELNKWVLDHTPVIGHLITNQTQESINSLVNHKGRLEREINRLLGRPNIHEQDNDDDEPILILIPEDVIPSSQEEKDDFSLDEDDDEAIVDSILEESLLDLQEEHKDIVEDSESSDDDETVYDDDEKAQLIDGYIDASLGYNYPNRYREMLSHHPGTPQNLLPMYRHIPSSSLIKKYLEFIVLKCRSLPQWQHTQSFHDYHLKYHDRIRCQFTQVLAIHRRFRGALYGLHKYFYSKLEAYRVYNQFCDLLVHNETPTSFSYWAYFICGTSQDWYEMICKYLMCVYYCDTETHNSPQLNIDTNDLYTNIHNQASISPTTESRLKELLAFLPLSKDLRRRRELLIGSSSVPQVTKRRNSLC